MKQFALSFLIGFGVLASSYNSGMAQDMERPVKLNCIGQYPKHDDNPSTFQCKANSKMYTIYAYTLALEENKKFWGASNGYLGSLIGNKEIEVQGFYDKETNTLAGKYIMILKKDGKKEDYAYNMLSSGYARANKNLIDEKRLLKAEAQARKAERGLWKKWKKELGETDL